MREAHDVDLRNSPPTSLGPSLRGSSSDGSTESRLLLVALQGYAGRQVELGGSSSYERRTQASQKNTIRTSLFLPPRASPPEM